MSVELRATYRVQFHSRFGFADAAGIVDYLARLGISHLYSSPYLQAALGSTHGYDVVNYHKVNEELGGEAGHAQLCAALKERGLSQVLDIVPNHMAIAGRQNPWWWDVLENGPSSRYAAYFDVDWDPPETKLRNIVLLPVLGDHYGRVLDKGEIKLDRDADAFVIRYQDHVFPVSPRSLDTLLGAVANRCGSDRLAFVADALGQLPPSTATDWVAVRRRHRDKEVLRQALLRLCREEAEIDAAINEKIVEINGSFAELNNLLERQNYRLAYWRTAGRDLAYRRFFDINTLIGIRAEDERVFADTHALVLDWLNQGLLDGVRVDHPDGLRDPQQYFERLHSACPKTWIVAEKILEPGEELPQSWPIAGTTGYDFIYLLNNLFIDPAGEAPLTEFYAEFTGASTDYTAMVREKKEWILREVLGSDLNRLTALFVDICERHPHHRDFTRHELHETLRGVIIWFPVYRTYVRAIPGQVRAQDQRIIEETIAAATANRPDLDPDLFTFFGEILLLQFRGSLESELVMRFQQLTGPAMAKGVEDTAFYNFNRLVSLNEVGGDPSRFGRSVEEFHQACAKMQADAPRSMLASSTHDTKRSEDVRARLHVLSEIPDRWRDAVLRWTKLNSRHRRGDWPDSNMEYLLYQTLVGAWPIECERIVAYMEKASREAKVHTSWSHPNSDYDSALRGFIEAILRDPEFCADLENFVRPLVKAGRINSLAQTLIKLTAPGIPDFYQGSELWDLSLVDPDNRRPVDYDLRRKLLAELDGATPERVWKRIDDGLPKLWVIRQTLNARKCRHLLLPEDTYEPIECNGTQAVHLIAFRRGEPVVTVAPRLNLKRGGRWHDARVSLPAGYWRNDLTGEHFSGEVQAEALFKRFPVALLLREKSGCRN